MSQTIVHIDIGPLEADISGLQSKIAELQAVLKAKTELRNYILQHGMGGKFHGMLNGNSNTTQIKQLEKALDFESMFEIPANGSITQFILAYIKNRNRVQPEMMVETSDIVRAYAAYTRKDVVDIRNNVYNALSRLKATDLAAKPIQGKGSAWFFKK